MIRVFLVQTLEGIICVNRDNDVDSARELAQGARELTEQEVNDIFGDYAGYADSNDSRTHVTGDTLETAVVTFDMPDPGEALTAYKCNCHNMCCGNADSCFHQLTEAYPGYERDTWNTQEVEARAWLTDNSTPTPFIDAMLAAGVTRSKSDLVDDIIYNADQFRAASASITGQRVAICDSITACTSREELDDVDLTITLPVINLRDK